MLNSMVIYSRLQLQLLSAYKQTLPRGWSDVRKPGMTTMIWLVLDGGAYLQIDDKEYRIKAGDFCLLPETARMSYGCDKDESFTLWCTHLNTDLLSGSLFDWIDCSSWVTPLTPAEMAECIRFYQQIVTYSPQLLPLKQQFTINRSMHSLLEIFFTHIDIQEKRREDWIGNTLQYINAHLQEDLTVESLARRVALHPNYFIRCFRTRMGVSPAKYIADNRFRFACAMLDQQTKNLLEIGEAINMPEMQVFYSFFKRHAGMTPRQYLLKKEREEKL